MNKFKVEGDISKFYLELVAKFQKNKNLAMPSKIAKKINRRNDTVSKQLLKLCRENYLTRNRFGKEDYRYKLNKGGIRFLEGDKI